MAEERLQRRLAAIMSADVVGYSRLMGVDEAGKTNYYRMLLTGIDQLDVVSISPARHFVMFDQPEKFSAALDQALAKVYGR